MNIEDLHDGQKSIIIVSLMGRLIKDSQNPKLYGMQTWQPISYDEPGETVKKFPVPNFYNPQNMQYAWRVLNWVWGSRLAEQYLQWRLERDETPETMPPNLAVQLWLDKILELANENGMIDWRKFEW